MTELRVVIFDVQHGACAMLGPFANGELGPLAMIDSGDNSETGWTPSSFIKNSLGRQHVDYLFVTNADQDHLSDLAGLSAADISVGSLTRNPSLVGDELEKLKRAQCSVLSDDIKQYIALTRPTPIPCL